MLKRKNLAAMALLMVAGLSCDRGIAPPTTGGINIVLLSQAGTPLSVSARGTSESVVDMTPIGNTANVLLDGVRVTVTGPTSKVETVNTASGSNFLVTVSGLDPGSYTVTVEGLVGGMVAHYGRTTNVVVSAGASTDAPVTFPVFQPSPDPTIADTVDVLRFTVLFAAVPNATSYVVEWSTSPTMSNPSNQSVTATSADIAVTAEGNYYYTVKAVNSTVGTSGLPSTPRSVFVFQGVATVTVTPPSPGINPGETQQFTAVARDADNAVVPNVTWFWASSNHNAATISQTGLATGVGAGQATITAVGKGTPGSASLTVGAQQAHHLVFSVEPGSAVAGDPLSPAVQVEIRDANNNRVTSSRDPVTIAIATNPSIGGAGVLTGTKVVNAIDGIASFTGVWINKTGSGYTLSASSGSLIAAASTGFNISPAAAAKLAFSGQPSNVQGNVAMSPNVTVTITDQFDNATTATNNVTVALGENPWKTPFAVGGTITGSLTRGAFSGVATFNDLRVDKPAPGYSLAASSTALIGATSGTFNTNLTVSQVVTGHGSHSCVVAAGGSYCFGTNGSGQLGAFLTFGGQDSIAALVRGGLTFVAVTAGGSHSCGLTAAGAAHCWGNNGNGQLGNNSTTSSSVPVPVADGHVFASIDAGSNHTCGITTNNDAVPAEDEQVYCWGYNGLGMIGDGLAIGTVPFYQVPFRVVEPLQTGNRAVQVSAGANHTCARVVGGTAYCWGYGDTGQLGTGAALPSCGGVCGGPIVATPQLVTGGHDWRWISAGGSHTCGVTFTHATLAPARCFGYNGNGALGDGTTTTTSTPVQALPLHIVSVSAGGSHSCAVQSNGTGYCWGFNGSGQIGDESTPLTQISTPVAVQGSLSFTTSGTGAGIEAGGNHTCGRTTTGVFCWGSNSNGRLGSPGINVIKRAPTQIVQ
jgi:alpha-tubulin suppressor-like RCC1 family protein